MVRPARPADCARHRLRPRGIRELALPVIAATVLVASTALPTAASAADTSPVSGGHGATPVLAAKPYMGWSSWSLESTKYPGYGVPWLTEDHVKEQADVMASKLKSHGYEYVNIDAGWATSFDEYGRPIPNPDTFPSGMKSLGDYLHAKDLKFGLYLAVGLDPAAYNDGKNRIHNAPGCTTADIVYPDLRKTNGWDYAYKMDFGDPCSQKYIDSLADQLAGWGADFLKVDGVGPGSWQGDENHDNTSDVKAWHTALERTGRPIELTLSWSLSHTQADVWKANSNGSRIDTDVECYCDTLVTWNNSVKGRWNDVVQWIDDAGPGYWNNLDALNVGVGAMDGITDAERQSYATLWAIESAPLYSGDDLTKLDAYGLSLLTNDEVIAVDQAGNPAKPVSQSSPQQVWYSRNADGSYTVALFNLGGEADEVTADFSDLGISGKASVRDLWSHKNLGSVSGSLTETLPAHGSRLFTFTPKNSSAPGTPLAVHGTAATASSVTLAWDKVNTGASPVTGYAVYANGAKVATTKGTSTTVSGLSAGTGYSFTVVANDAEGRRSAPSKAVPVTTPAAGGPTGYEAEASANTLTGSASVFDCSGCSGGKKVGNLPWGAVAVNNVTAPRDGTYLMKLDYVDGDSSRVIEITVNGETVQVPLAGTNDNNWSTAQSITMPIPLKAGSNTLTFTNPVDWAPDIDRITL
ncbi:fibronectin type III domain-containing protein [Streptomyces sp. NPDC058470]|uniref:fibronectin type III domain-containing protein n=1 Tax=Streptomyces sp. NPDC058470 TaxID=3346515 RepID=UPI00364FBFE3